MSKIPQNKNLFLYSAVISVNSISLYGGGTFSWTSPIIPRLRSNDTSINPLPRPITVFEETCLSSILVLGTLFGALFSMTVANKIGRKKTLMLFSGGMLIAYSSFIFVHNIIWYIVGRFLIGLGVGCGFSVLPSYVAEIADDSTRGITGCGFGIGNSLGHIINFCIAPFISFRVWNIINVIPVAVFYLTFAPFIPESPYYLLATNKEAAAKRSLSKFRGHSIINKELEIMRNSIEESQKNSYNFIELFHSDLVRRCLFAGCGLLMCQPSMGYNSVSAYLQPIFDASGGYIPSEYPVMIVGFCTVISNISTIFLVERLKRKTLLIIGSIGAAICLTLLGTYFYLQTNNFDVSNIFWLPAVSAVSYIFIINMGFGSVPWIISGELYPLNAKTVGNGLGSAAHITVILIVMSVFPYMSLTFGMPVCFWIFAGFAICALIFIVVIVPETKGKSLTEIQGSLKQ